MPARRPNLALLAWGGPQPRASPRGEAERPNLSRLAPRATTREALMLLNSLKRGGGWDRKIGRSTDLTGSSKPNKKGVGFPRRRLSLVDSLVLSTLTFLTVYFSHGASHGALGSGRTRYHSWNDGLYAPVISTRNPASRGANLAQRVCAWGLHLHQLGQSSLQYERLDGA